MAASTRINRFFSIASLTVLATTGISLSAAPIAQEFANRASGRINNELAHRGSERLNDTFAYRGSGRFDSNGGYGLLAYRASGRFSQGLDLAYRGSERGIKTA